MTDDERHSLISEAAEEAAHQAVGRLFSILGVDIDDRDQVQELRKDFSHNRRWRKRMDRISETATTTVTKYTVIAIIGLLVLGVSEKMRQTVKNVPDHAEKVIEEVIE